MLGYAKPLLVHTLKVSPLLHDPNFTVTVKVSTHTSRFNNNAMDKPYQSTVFENHRKSLIHHCERSELRLHFEWTKVDQNAKNGQFGDFLKT